MNQVTKSTHTQCEQIIKALEDGRRLTSLEALEEFRCMRLASRISEIKHKYNIPVCKRTITLKSGKRVAEYYL